MEKQGTWGGPRRGAGRKPTRGTIRRNRVVVTLTDAELARLHRWAEERSLPVGTVAYEIVERALRRREPSHGAGGKK